MTKLLCATVLILAALTQNSCAKNEGPKLNRLDAGDTKFSPEMRNGLMEGHGAVPELLEMRTAPRANDLEFDKASDVRGNMPIMQEYLREGRSIKWLAEKAGISSDFLQTHLGVARQGVQRDLTSSEINTVFRNIHPPAQADLVLHELELAINLAHDIQSYLDQVQSYVPALMMTVPGMVEVYHGKKKLSTVFDGLAAMCAILMFTTSTANVFVGIGFGVARFIFKVVGQQLKMEERPVPEGRDRWLRWSAEQSTLTMSFVYAAFEQMFAEGTPEDLRTMMGMFRSGQYSAQSRELARSFRVGVLQALINEPGEEQKSLSSDRWDQSLFDPRRWFRRYTGDKAKFKIYTCEGKHCAAAGREVGGKIMKTNMNRRQIEYLAVAGVDFDDMYLGRNGWNIANGGKFTCHHDKLEIFGNRSRCREKFWDEAYADANDRNMGEKDEEGEEMQEGTKKKNRNNEEEEAEEFA